MKDITHSKKLIEFRKIRERLSLFFGKQEKFSSRSILNECWLGSVYVPQSSTVLNYKNYVVIVKNRKNKRR